MATPSVYWRQVVVFLIHLRWHYQIFILSGCYLLGGLYHTGVQNWYVFVLQFLNVHLLLFGGATAFNSFWDKDKGRIGGLKHPPVMAQWMRPASIGLQFAGLMLAVTVSLYYTGVYFLSIVMFWLYSTPVYKWKGHPWLSMVAISVSTGICSFIMGHLAIGGTPVLWTIVPAVGCSLVLLSMYPVSQIFQMEEDRERGYRTFAISYGLLGIRVFFAVAFTLGILIVSFTLRWVDPGLSKLFLIVSGISGGFIAWQLKMIKGHADDYDRVMRIKYISSFAFVVFISICLTITS